MKTRTPITLVIIMAAVFASQSVLAEISDTELKSIMTPDKVQTSTGTLNFLFPQ